MFTFQHLRRDIIGCSTYSSLALAVELQLGCKTEVANLYFQLAIQKQVAKLEISMNDAVSMQVLDCITDLYHVVFYFLLYKSLPSPQQFIQRLVLAKLKQNVHVLRIFKIVFKPHYVFVIERAMDLDLAYELLFLP